MKIHLLILLLLAALLAACEHVPITGRSQLQMLPIGVETSMGLNSFQEVLKKEKISHDPKLNEQVQRVGNRIAAATGRSDYQWEFKVIEDDKMVNAFCLPGGKVAVYTGLFPITRDDAGLAAVIGHEVAHAIARHGGERLSQQLLIEGLTIAAVASTQDSQKADLYAGLLGLGATVGVLLPYSRLHESEADRMGLIYMPRLATTRMPRAIFGYAWPRRARAKASRRNSCPPTRRTLPASSRSRACCRKR